MLPVLKYAPLALRLITAALAYKATSFEKIVIAILPASIATSKTHLTILAQNALMTALLAAIMGAALLAVQALILEKSFQKKRWRLRLCTLRSCSSTKEKYFVA